MSVVSQTVELLTLPIDERHPSDYSGLALPLHDKISVRDLSFTYPGQQSSTLEQISFEIPVGS